MGKVKIGSMRQKLLVEGDVNLLEDGEILVGEDQGYTILRERSGNGSIKTYVIIPLSDFKKGESKKKKVNETTTK